MADFNNAMVAMQLNSNQMWDAFQQRFNAAQEENQKSFSDINERIDRMDNQLNFLCNTNQMMNENLFFPYQAIERTMREMQQQGIPITMLSQGQGSKTKASQVTDAPWPLSRPVRNSLILKIDSIIVEESKPVVRLTAGLRQQEGCHRACNQLKIPSIELGSFSLGIEILWLANGCENIGVAMVE
ncbi:hypothetical protein PIB30_067453 [Stylosanthes scabra]|uniref:Uncharacterized protein n=1 Tax=Stylosanthes scabra TaxID=79078 RepID=A0ABU6ZLA6_9FABA|nr:hypothetical protein [Stylosanthes scabra]